jgi:hypothetical protein
MMLRYFEFKEGVHMKRCIGLMILTFSGLSAMEKVKQSFEPAPVEKHETAVKRKVIICNLFGSQIIVTYKLKEGQNTIALVIDPAKDDEIVLGSPLEFCTVRFNSLIAREKFGITPLDYADAINKLYDLHETADIIMFIKQNGYSTYSKYTSGLAWVLPAEVTFKFPRSIGWNLVPLPCAGLRKTGDVFGVVEGSGIRALLKIPGAEYDKVVAAKEAFLKKWLPIIESENPDEAHFATVIVDIINRSFREYVAQLLEESRRAASPTRYWL